MRVLDSGHSLAEHALSFRKHWEKHDFFFLHFKDPDARGEDGDFDGKVRTIETLDEAIPALLALAPDVVVVTGDHSTPSVLRSHSFHPVPLLLWAPATVRADDVTTFGERACLHCGLGRILARELMPLVLAHAGRLRRFGA
jgi:2,3-bisphosphoglycerate-independent phosphoglycerate mutase